MTLDRPADYWIGRLTEAGIPTGPIQDAAQVLQDPQSKARNMVVDVLGEDGNPAYVAAGIPIKLSSLVDPATRRPAPPLDGNRAAIPEWLA